MPKKKKKKEPKKRKKEKLAERFEDINMVHYMPHSAVFKAHAEHHGIDLNTRSIWYPYWECVLLGANAEETYDEMNENEANAAGFF